MVFYDISVNDRIDISTIEFTKFKVPLGTSGNKIIIYH